MRRSRFAPIPSGPASTPLQAPAPAQGLGEAILRGAPTPIPPRAAGGQLGVQLAAAGVPAAAVRTAGWTEARTRALRVGSEVAIAAVSLALLAFVIWPSATRPILLSIAQGGFVLAAPGLVGLAVWTGLSWALGLPLKGVEWVQGARLVGALVLVAGLVGWGFPLWWASAVEGGWIQRLATRSAQGTEALLLTWVGFHVAAGLIQPRQR